MDLRLVFCQICTEIAGSHTYFYPKVKIDLCHDRDDNFLLELAATCKADFLITNDKQLLKLNPFEETQIIKIGDFLNLFQTSLASIQANGEAD